MSYATAGVPRPAASVGVRPQPSRTEQARRRSGALEDRGLLRLGDPADELDGAVQAQLPDELLETRALRPVADDRQRCAVDRPAHLGQRADRVIEPLRRDEPADRHEPSGRRLGRQLGEHRRRDGHRHDVDRGAHAELA